MSYRERLEQAVEQAGWFCIECCNARVTVEFRPDIGEWIPVSHHYARTADDACPVLSGGVAARMAHEDLWAALDRYIPVGDYGELSWARRELVTS